jgi:hypothetical protein
LARLPDADQPFEHFVDGLNVAECPRLANRLRAMRKELKVQMLGDFQSLNLTRVPDPDGLTQIM